MEMKHRTTEHLGFKGTSRGHLAQPKPPSANWLPRTTSRQLWNASPHLHPPYPLWATRSVTLRVRKRFLPFRQTLLCFSVCPHWSCWCNVRGVVFSEVFKSFTTLDDRRQVVQTSRCTCRVSEHPAGQAVAVGTGEVGIPNADITPKGF